MKWQKRNVMTELSESALREGRRVVGSWRLIRMVSYRFTGTCYERSKRSISV